MLKESRTIALISALGILSFIFLTVVLSSIVFIFHGTVSPLLTLISLLVSLGHTYTISKKYELKKAYKTPLVTIGIIAVSVFLGSATLDITYDGNNYHKHAIGELKNEWNPLYSDIGNIYSNTYPKASWIFASSIYQITGSVESGKAINFLAIAITFLVAYWYIRARLNTNRSIIVALLLAMSPVVAMQLFSNYVDGLMGGLLITLTILFNALLDRKIKIQKRYIYAAIVALIVMISNLKFTGIIYSGIIAVVYLGYFIWRRDWVITKELVVAGVASLVFAVGIVGAPTYIKNFVTHGHPLYPLMGEGAVPILADNIPKTYADKNRVHKFLESNFGETDNISGVWGFTEDKLDSRLKVPFTFNMSELQLLSIGSPDIRQAGYGVWFGGVLLLAGLALIYVSILNRHKFSKIGNDIYLIVLPILPIIITALAFEDSWWARYLPQLIVFPVVALVIMYLCGKNFLASALVFTMLFNMIIILSLGISHQRQTVGLVNKNIDSLIQCSSEEPQKIVVTPNYGDFTGSTYNMLDRCSSLEVVREKDAQKLDSAYVEIWNGIYTKDRIQQ